MTTFKTFTTTGRNNSFVNLDQAKLVETQAKGFTQFFPLKKLQGGGTESFLDHRNGRNSRMKSEQSKKLREQK